MSVKRPVNETCKRELHKSQDPYKRDFYESKETYKGDLQKSPV